MKKILLSFAIACLTFISIAQNSSSSSTNNNNSGTNQKPPPGIPMQVEPGTQPGYKDPIEIYKLNPTQPSKPFDPTKVNNYPFYSVPGDPTQARIYKLKNGLTVFLSQNKLEPRIQTLIAVKAGSKNDPKETTGLAHYLEHMMFKGTGNVGSTNWQRERGMIMAIAGLYEKHRNEKDPQKKKAIYAEIDKLSQDAAKFAIPNEYDKMISMLGAKGTNAYTSNERTVYVNDIPSNEMEKWLILESERFHQLVLRLFHTELEAVYEEYNMGQDRDGNKAYKEFMKALFPTHQYGTQTTIGEGEHLKNPSMNNIVAYWTAYYVPNNMALCLSGDLNYDVAIQMIDKYFGNYLPKPVPPFKVTSETQLTEIQRREVFGQEAESLSMGYRLPGAKTSDITVAKLAAGILSNGQAGLIDLDLVQEQKVLYANAFTYELTDYGVFWLSADPREGQTLEDCETLLLQEMEKLKKGEFDEWLIDAVVNDKRLALTKSYENNGSRASAFVDCFIKGLDWKYYSSELDRMQMLTKQNVMDFANKWLQNYVIVYKRQGEDNNVEKVDKPQITPIEANRDSSSKFLQDFEKIPSMQTAPDFVKYNERIKTQTLNSGVDVSYIKNELNQLFELYYILDMGSENDKTLSLAINYLPYLGTEKYTPAELQKEFFKYGLSFNVFASADRTYVSLTGLESNLEKGVELFEHIISNVVADKDAYEELVKGILKEREDAKADKNTILNAALFNYAKYGKVSPYTDILSENELKKIKPDALVEKISSLTAYKHRIFYYGQKNMEDVLNVLNVYHKTPAQLNTYPVAKIYPELETIKKEVLFVHYDMVQAQVVFLSKDKLFDKTLMPEARAFGEYFGSGLSSIVFQEIRETKALAYSAFAGFSTPANTDEAHYIRAAVYTQADKMQQAIEAMMEIMNTMPKAEEQFNQSRMAVMKQIESERITKSGVFWNYESAKR
ncbi:MAG: insulinase family protein, partial [Fimbriimonadaceae bacterium]|nr:insulinase family protein [Chitinophagales bacterium]